MSNKNDLISPNKKNQSLLGGSLVHRYHDFFNYTFFGFLASLVNIVTFIVLHSWLKIAIVYANTIAFFVSNLFSFFMNKHIVFTSGTKTERSFFVQLGLFFMYRIISIVPDNLIMLVGLSWLKWNVLIVKIIDQILVGIFNYFTTKSVFKKETNNLREILRVHNEKQQK